MNVTLNGRWQRAADDATVADLVRAFAAADGCAVAVNDEVVPRRDWEQRRLVAGDRIEVLTAVQGG